MFSKRESFSLIAPLKYISCILLAMTLSSCPSGVSSKPIVSPEPTEKNTVSLSPVSIEGNTPVSYPWTSFLGSTGGISTGWSASVRGVGLGETGKSNSSTASFNQEVSHLIGVQQRTVMLPVGGLNSSKDVNEAVDFLNGIKRDNAKEWKNIVYKQALNLARMPNASDKVYWQIGNEINSKDHSLAFHTLANSASLSGAHSNDDFVISNYVEYYLAPSVEALHKASHDSLSSDDRIRIALGSIANASNPASIEWLNKLLTYKIRGDFAPSLAGKQVKDLVNTITIHYLITAGDTSWKDILNRLTTQWIGQGKISGVWLTEEIGKIRAYAGRGAATALKVTARYLDWSTDRSLTPTQGRVFMWGANIGNPGTTGNEGMQALYDFLGNTSVKKYLKPVTVTSSELLESYAFQSNTDPTKAVVIVFPKVGEKPQRLEKTNLTDRERVREENKLRRHKKDNDLFEKNVSPTPSIQDIEVGSSNLNENISVVMHLFSPKGNSIIPVSVVKQSSSYKLSVAKNVELPDQSVALFLITSK